MNIKNNNYECKRCFYQCYQLNDMKKHLNKKIICDRTIDSYNYKDEDLIKLSLIRKSTDVIKEYDFLCDNCNKKFCNNSNLMRHKKSSCKNIKINNKKEEMIDEIKNSIDDKNNILNYNITNNITTNNYTNNIISVNINLINSFEENWNTTHIDDKTKCFLLLNNSKFTATLENILENEVNLNVLLDNTSENGLVFNKDSFVNMSVKDIVKKTMDKLYNKLCDFKNDISDKKLNIDEKLLDDHIKIAYSKYNNYIEDSKIQESVDIFIKGIYNRKKEDTLLNYNLINSGY